MQGFGHDSFGVDNFGSTDFSHTVLWREIPVRKRQEDVDNGGWYEKFISSVDPSVNQLKVLIEKSFDSALDARLARKDLLKYLAGNFGIVPDLDEPEEFQRTKIDIVGRWRLIKGTEDSYKVIAAIHGFEAEVSNVWESENGFTTAGPLDGDFEKGLTSNMVIDLYPSRISGSTDLDIENSLKRMFVKIRRDVLPINADIVNIGSYNENYLVSIGHRFDIIGGDEEDLDTNGLVVKFNDDSW